MAAVFKHVIGASAPFRVRVLGVLVAGAVVALTSATPPWAARTADVDLTAGALRARAAVGLPPVGANAAVRAAGVALLDGRSAQAAFASSGGAGTLVTATAPAGETLSTAQVKAAVFDPRVTAIAALRRAQTVAVAAAFDPQRPFPRPVVAGALVDPAVAGSLAVLFPPPGGTIPAISLQQNRSGEVITIDIAATAVPGAQGAILVQLKGRDRITGPQLGYGIDYTLTIGNAGTYRVRTRPVPSVLTSRSFVPGPGFTGSDRRAFLKAVSLVPGVGRQIVDVIGGAITVHVLANSAPICVTQTSCTITNLPSRLCSWARLRIRNTRSPGRSPRTRSG